jgi:hypothetical protein
VKDPRFSFIGDLATGAPVDMLTLLGGTVIRVEIGSETVRSFCGQIIAFQLATLLARLFDRVELVGDNACLTDEDIEILRGPFLPALRAHLRTLRPTTSTPESGRVLRVRIGDDEKSEADIFVGAVEWVALISVANPQPVGLGKNPIGALAAGALGAGEVFKHIFEDKLTGAMLASEIRFSLLTNENVDGTGLHNQPRIPDDFKLDATLIGCGSVGCAFALGLILTPSASGTITVVDNGIFDTNNPYKYVLLDLVSARKKMTKARWLRGKINRQGSGNVKARAFVGTVQEYLASLPITYRIPIAVSAVDTLETRLEIQDLLPATVVNAGIRGTMVEVSSHGFGKGACLGCLIMQQSMESWNAQPLATRTGLSAERVRSMIVTNAPITERDMFSMIAAGVLSPELVTELPDYVGQPLLSFLNRVLYAETRLVSGDGNGGARITTAFVSGFAGILLFAEFVKAIVPELAPYRLNNSYRQDLIGIPVDGVYQYPRDPQGACSCFSNFRLRVYKEKYGYESGTPRPTRSRLGRSRARRDPSPVQGNITP